MLSKNLRAEKLSRNISLWLSQCGASNMKFSHMDIGSDADENSVSITFTFGERLNREMVNDCQKFFADFLSKRKAFDCNYHGMSCNDEGNYASAIEVEPLPKNIHNIFCGNDEGFIATTHVIRDECGYELNGYISMGAFTQSRVFNKHFLEYLRKEYSKVKQHVDDIQFWNVSPDKFLVFVLAKQKLGFFTNIPHKFKKHLDLKMPEIECARFALIMNDHRIYDRGLMALIRNDIIRRAEDMGTNELENSADMQVLTRKGQLCHYRIYWSSKRLYVEKQSVIEHVSVMSDGYGNLFITKPQEEDKKTRVFGIGCNRFGRLGLCNTDLATSQQEVMGIDACVVKMFSSARYGACLTKQGKVFIFGSIGGQDRLMPTEVLKTKKVKDVRATNRACYFLTEKQVFEYDETKLSEIGFFSGKNINKIHGNLDGENTCFSSEKEGVFVFGDEENICGIPTSSPEVSQAKDLQYKAVDKKVPQRERLSWLMTVFAKNPSFVLTIDEETSFSPRDMTMRKD